VARAYFAGLETAAAPEIDDSTGPAGVEAGESAAAAESAVAEIVGALRDAGVMPQPPRALLERPQSEQPRLELIRALMRDLQEHDGIAYFRRGEELAYLANVLMAGCSIQARTMTPQESSDAAVAICNLGLENWPGAWAVQDLVRVFEVGMSVLHREVGMASARDLVAVLEVFRCEDPAISRELEMLRRTLDRQLQNGTPWLAADSFEVLNSVDTLAWAGLLGLIGECPVLHAAVRASEGRRLLRVSPTDFEFIATNEQIESARRFIRRVPELLAG
jgi:hypothetical protein